MFSAARTPQCSLKIQEKRVIFCFLVPTIHKARVKVDCCATFSPVSSPCAERDAIFLPAQQSAEFLNLFVLSAAAPPLGK